MDDILTDLGLALEKIESVESFEAMREDILALRTAIDIFHV